MDRFEAMRAFTRIVERSSFSRAAEDLGLPRSSVTDAVKELEARLGVQLLQRTTRRVSPTSDGEAYHASCLRLLAELEDAEGAFRGAKPSGPLHVSVHGTLAGHFVMPRLPGFLAEYPGIKLLLGEGDRFVDLVREGVDCALRVGRLPDSELTSRQLTLLPEATCASPSYLARHGTPPHAGALDGHVMVGFRSSATGAALPLEFTGKGKPRHVTLPTIVTVTGAQSYAAAARAGLGLIQAPRYRLEEDFRRGTLVPVLEAAPPAPTPVSVLYPRTRHLPLRARVFVDWLAGIFRDGKQDGHAEAPGTRRDPPQLLDTPPTPR